MRARWLFLLLIFGSMIASGLGTTAASPRPKNKEFRQDLEMSTLLQRAAEYYKRLEAAVVYYFCVETVTEMLHPVPEKHKGFVAFHADAKGWPSLYPKKTLKNEWVYDYQMLRRGKSVQERRVLLRENGLEKKQEHASLKIRIFDYWTMAFGPNAFDKEFQERSAFTLLRRERIFGRDALVVQVEPRPPIPSNLMWGLSWIDEVDSTFLRIEFSPRSIRNFFSLERKGRDLHAVPDTTIQIEFAVLHDGIRFPSRFRIEEAYIADDGERFALSSIDVAYTDYRFFSVDVRVNEKKGP